MEAGAEVSGPPRRVGGSSRGRSRSLLVLAVLGGIGAGAVLSSVHGTGATEPSWWCSSAGLHGQATWAAGALAAPAITTLHDQSGHRFSLAELHGRTVAMTFFDSHCTQACPLEGRAVAAAERELPRAQRPVLVVISVNPLDTPASTRGAAREMGPRAGRRVALAARQPCAAPRVWKAYHIFVAPPRRRRHQPHRGALPDRSPRLRALGLPLSVRAAVRGAGPADAGRRAGQGDEPDDRGGDRPRRSRLNPRRGRCAAARSHRRAATTSR